MIVKIMNLFLKNNGLVNDKNGITIKKVNIKNNINLLLLCVILLVL